MLGLLHPMIAGSSQRLSKNNPALALIIRTKNPALTDINKTWK
ncbi:hypothetical protein O59_002019 [Cellvibrio sp. BR]|nr:hypothetical protein O59_002019 [Cellvibrio sp. BR]